MPHNQKGVVTLEACVSVLSFLILMLLLSSLFVLFMAQNEVSHGILETAESLSLDAYSINSFQLSANQTIGTIEDQIAVFVKSLFGSSKKSPNYVSDDRWFYEPGIGKKQVAGDVAGAVRKRFIGYVGGNESETDELLKKLNVADGLDGIDFSDSSVKDGTLYIVAKYELEYDFNIWGVENIPIEQTVCVKLWE